MINLTVERPAPYRIGNAFIYHDAILQSRVSSERPWLGYARIDCIEAAIAAYKCVRSDPQRFRIYYPTVPGRVVEV